MFQVLPPRRGICTSHPGRFLCRRARPSLQNKTETHDPFAQSRSSRCSMYWYPNRRHPTMCGILPSSAFVCCTWLSGWPTGSLNSKSSCTAKSGTAQLRDSLRSFGIFEARNPSLFQDLSSFHSLSVHGSRGTPNKSKFKYKWPDASDFVSAFAQAYCGQAPRTARSARWASVQVSVSSASHLCVRLPVSGSCSSACT